MMETRTLSRRIALAHLAAGGVLAAAACGGAGSSTATERSPIEGIKPAGTVTWSFWAVSQEQADNMLARVRDFNNAHPEIKVEALWVLNADYRSKIIALISAGTPPEVTQVDAYDMPAFVAQKLLQRLEPYIKGDKSFNMDDFLPGAFLENHHVFNGAYYAIPNGAESPRVLFYNRAKWLEAGLPLPNDLETKGQWTWETFAQHLTKVTTGGAQPNWGFSAQLGVHPEPHSFISSNNGKTLSEDLKTFVGADDRSTIEALQFQADLIHKYKVAPPPGEDLGSGDPFITGRMATKISGIWDAAPLFVRPDFDYRVAPLPRSPKGVRKTVVKPNALTLPVGVQGQKAAAGWELIKYISGPDYQKAQIDVGQVMTNHKSLVDYFKQKSPVHDASVFTDAFDKKEVVPIPLIPRWADYRAVVDEEMGKVRRGEVNVQTALGSIKARTADLLKA